MEECFAPMIGHADQSQVIALVGAISWRTVAIWSMTLRFSDRFFDIEMNRFQKFLQIRLQHFYRRRFPENISFRRCGKKKLYGPKQRVLWIEIFDFLIEKSAFSLELKNRTFCLDISFPSTSINFSGPAGGRSLCARVRPLVGTWFVEWLHRRVIASAGAISWRKVAI